MNPLEDIHDIRGPKFVWPVWGWPAVIAGVLLLALAVYGIRRWLKSRRRPRVLTPAEQALAALDALGALMTPEHAREFGIAVSDIVRRYIEQRFDVVATQRTTEEFLKDLLESAKASLLRHRALLAEFLQQCDLVKFAGVGLTIGNMQSLQASAKAFVLETAKPDPPAAIEPPAAVAA
jgi:hypothetical protein